MSLFRCEQCGCVENTACCNYWSRNVDKQSLLCSECDPAIGKWHANFAKRSAAGMLLDQSGHLWSKAQVDGGSLPKHYRIVGEVPAEIGTETPAQPHSPVPRMGGHGEAKDANGDSNA